MWINVKRKNTFSTLIHPLSCCHGDRQWRQLQGWTLWSPTTETMCFISVHLTDWNQSWLSHRHVSGMLNPRACRRLHGFSSGKKFRERMKKLLLWDGGGGGCDASYAVHPFERSSKSRGVRTCDLPQVVTYSGCSLKHSAAARVLAPLLEPCAVRSSRDWE